MLTTKQKSAIIETALNIKSLVQTRDAEYLQRLLARTNEIQDELYDGLVKIKPGTPHSFVDNSISIINHCITIIVEIEMGLALSNDSEELYHDA